MADIVSDFIEPLVKAGCKPRVGDDLAVIAGHIARAKPGATSHQLRGAVDRVLRTWKFKTFPTVAICVQAIEASPRAAVVAEPRRSAPSQASEAPIVTRCRAYVAEYEAAGEAGRARLEKVWPGRYENSTNILRLWAA